MTTATLDTDRISITAQGREYLAAPARRSDVDRPATDQHQEGYCKPATSKYGTTLAEYSRNSFDPDFAGQTDCDGARSGRGGW